MTMDELATYVSQHHGKKFFQERQFSSRKKLPLLPVGVEIAMRKGNVLFKKGITSKFRSAQNRVTSLLQNTNISGIIINSLGSNIIFT